MVIRRWHDEVQRTHSQIMKRSGESGGFQCLEGANDRRQPVFHGTITTIGIRVEFLDQARIGLTHLLSCRIMRKAEFIQRLGLQACTTGLVGVRLVYALAIGIEEMTATPAVRIMALRSTCAAHWSLPHAPCLLVTIGLAGLERGIFRLGHAIEEIIALVELGSVTLTEPVKILVPLTLATQGFCCLLGSTAVTDQITGIMLADANLVYGPPFLVLSGTRRFNTNVHELDAELVGVFTSMCHDATTWTVQVKGARIDKPARAYSQHIKRSFFAFPTGNCR